MATILLYFYSFKYRLAGIDILCNWCQHPSYVLCMVSKSLLEALVLEKLCSHWKCCDALCLICINKMATTKSWFCHFYDISGTLWNFCRRLTPKVIENLYNQYQPSFEWLLGYLTSKMAAILLYLHPFSLHYRLAGIDMLRNSC